MRLAFYQGRSFVSKMIRFFTWGKYSHVAVMLDDGRILEAWHKPNGVRWISHLGEGHEVGTLVDVYDVPELPFPHSATTAAEDMIGMKYDFAGLLGFVFRRRTQDRNRLFCSEAAVMLAAIGGVDLIRAPAWKVSPSLLATSALLKFYGQAITGKRDTLIRRTNLPTTKAGMEAGVAEKPQHRTGELICRKRRRSGFFRQDELDPRDYTRGRMMKTMLTRFMLGALSMAVAGCASTPEERDARREAVAEILDVAIARYDDEFSPGANSNPDPINNTPDASANSAPLGVPSSDDFAGLRFRNSADCRDWKITATVSDVAFRGGNITWSEGAGSRAGWNTKASKGKTINGECLLLIPSRGEAGMFDFARVGQREKILSNLAPSHEGPGFFPNWVPKKGERVGFCLATISRDRGAAKMQERSNVVWFEWPKDGL